MIIMKIENLIQMFNSNLNFKPDSINLESYTNYLINKQMNLLVKQIKENKNKIFVLNYKDDLLSLICYRIIKNVQAIESFDFYICGKTIKTRKSLNSKEKKISSFKLKRKIEQNEAIIISPFNPIYQVFGLTKTFKNFYYSSFKPLEHFTIQELEQAQIFYHLGYYKKDKIQFNSDLTIVKDYSNFCLQNDNIFDFFSKNYYNNIVLVKLNGNDEELLNEVENFDGLAFYFFNEPPILFQSNYPLFLRHKVNIPKDYNCNNCDIPIKLIREYGAKPKFIGDWKSEEKNRII